MWSQIHKKIGWIFCCLTRGMSLAERNDNDYVSIILLKWPQTSCPGPNRSVKETVHWTGTPIGGRWRATALNRCVRVRNVCDPRRGALRTEDFLLNFNALECASNAFLLLARNRIHTLCSNKVIVQVTCYLSRSPVRVHVNCKYVCYISEGAGLVK